MNLYLEKMLNTVWDCFKAISIVILIIGVMISSSIVGIALAVVVTAWVVYNSIRDSRETKAHQMDKPEHSED